MTDPHPYADLPIPMTKAGRLCSSCHGSGGKQPSDGSAFRRCGNCEGKGIIRIDPAFWVKGVALHQEGKSRPERSGDLQAGWDAADTHFTAPARIAEAEARIAARSRA